VNNNNNTYSKGKPKGLMPLTNRYQRYLKQYWKCKTCSFRNLKTGKHQTCMVCSMLNVDDNTRAAIKAHGKKAKTKQSQDFPALPSTDNKKKGSNPLPPPTKPKSNPNPVQQKKNSFGWICQACTMENKPANQKCHMCNSPKPKKGGKGKNKKKVDLDWECQCTLINPADATKCGVCDSVRPGYEAGAATDEHKSNGNDNTYHAEPHYYGDEDVKNEMKSYENHWDQYKNKNKKHDFDHHNHNGHNGGSNKKRWQQQEEKKEAWSQGGKCSCGSGKKYKKCCKKLQKHQDKSYKNKFKNPNHEKNNKGYHNDNSWRGPPPQHGSHGFPGSGDAIIDELTEVIEDLEYKIANFKGKNAKQEKNRMNKQLDKLRKQRDELYAKRERERNQAIKARNRAQQRERDRSEYGYQEDNSHRNRNKKGNGNGNRGRNNNHRGNNNGYNNNGYDNNSSQAAANSEAANRIIAI